MSNELYILAMSAVTIGFFHTILGPDHYLPFIVMAKAGNWSKSKTVWVTILSGAGHVIGSVVLGFIGITAGIALNSLEAIESFRGDFAAWLLISFGFIYFVWGMRRAFKNKKHSHSHIHPGGIHHSHEHNHHDDHTHVHEKKEGANITPWVLFTIFVFGPCEALIPILMYPAAGLSFSGLILVVFLFGIVTIATMLGVVLLSIYGISIIPINRLEKYSHALAGGIILLSGIAVQFLGV